MNILLIDPRLTDAPSKNPRAYCDYYRGRFPLGLMYIQSFLKKNGYPRTIIQQYWRGQIQKVNSDIDKYKPDVVGISCNSVNRAYTRRLAALIKKIQPQIKIVVGGMHASLCGEDMLKNIFDYDYIVYGEGEYTLKDLLDNLGQKEKLKTVLGISFRLGGDVYTTPKRKRIDNLDALPFPCYSSLEPEALKHGEYFSIIASRGCMFNCSYCCSSQFYGHVWIHRSPENIVEEIQFLKQKFSVKYITFYDDCATADYKYAEKLFRLIAQKKIGIIFTLQTRPDSVDETLLQIMKKAGVKFLNFGVESGSEKILKVANRRLSSYTLDKERRVIKNAIKMGFECRIGIIVGWPQETIGDSWQSLKLIKQCRPNTINFNPLILYPGTELCKIAKSKDLISQSYWLTDKKPPKYTDLRYGLIRKILISCYELLLFLFCLINIRSGKRILETLRLRGETFDGLKLEIFFR
jgi:radical SAM superfamily enzyme YgiQ (UPF0313 family)